MLRYLLTISIRFTGAQQSNFNNLLNKFVLDKEKYLLSQLYINGYILVLHYV